MIKISSRCLNSALKGSANHLSCHNSVTRGYIYLIVHRNPTKQLFKPPFSGITSIGNDKRTMATAAKQTLTLDSMNPNVIKMDHVVRGPLLLRAGEIEEEIKQVWPRIQSNRYSAKLLRIDKYQCAIPRLNRAWRNHSKKSSTPILEIAMPWDSRILNSCEM